MVEQQLHPPWVGRSAHQLRATSSGSLTAPVRDLQAVIALAPERTQSVVVWLLANPETGALLVQPARGQPSRARRSQSSRAGPPLVHTRPNSPS
jgi:hypothetical protein